MARKTAATRTQPEPDPFFPDGGTPTWEVAFLFPAQGKWTESDYLALDRAYEGWPRIELANGRLEVLPMPTQTHQFILVFLFELLKAFTKAHAPGVVLPSGIRVRLKNGNYREPDLVYMKAEHAHRRHEEHWDGADLVVEIVSPDPKDRQRDWEDKARDYARNGIPEYWILDPQQQLIRVLTLRGKAYRVHGDFGPGTQATSVLLPGFAVAVDAALAPPGSEQPE
jgi:Uma2 family endonuclease